MRPRLGIGAFLFAAASVLSANTYIVTSTANAGGGTLRQAILNANANAGTDTIAFSITGSGVHTIQPTTPFPALTGAVTIDGYTQAGSSPNTNPAPQGLDAVLTIALDGRFLPDGSVGLQVSSSGVSIKGLSIYAFEGAGILVDAMSGGSIVRGCFVGLTPTGLGSSGVQQFGIRIAGGVAQIGGPTPGLRNLIAGAVQSNILVELDPTGVDIAGNLIGLTFYGDRLNGGQKSERGIDVESATDLTIGGATTGFRNVIAGATQIGVLVGHTAAGTEASGTRVEGNIIGLDVTGQKALGNVDGLVFRSQNCEAIGNVIGGGTGDGLTGFDAHGLLVQGNVIGTNTGGYLDLGNGENGINVDGDNWIIGGVTPGQENVIAFNHKEGIAVPGETGITMRGNLLWGNRLGIDLQTSNHGVSPNDEGDGDTGANGYQNFPLIQSVEPGTSSTRVQGVLNSKPSVTYLVDFYAASSCPRHPQEFLQAEQYLGAAQLTTDASGNAEFDLLVPAVLAPGQPVTATATDPAGNTSELSQRIVLAALPGSGPTGGGTVVAIDGMVFSAGATVTVGGVAATNVVVDGPTGMHATMPARPAGSVNAITVQTADGLHGTLPAGWVADFTDVPPAQQFHDAILRLVVNGVTAGCGGGAYCPLSTVKREQMAVFLLKAKHGICYAPPPCAGVFGDVSCASAFAPWIEALAAEGITGGCGGINYCPGNAVTREQMAVFLIRAKFGTDYHPHPCAGAFADVPCPSTYADWIEALADAGITSGCGGGNYCPSTAVRRDQMAAFLGNTFELQ